MKYTAPAIMLMVVCALCIDDVVPMRYTIHGCREGTKAMHSRRNYWVSQGVYQSLVWEDGKREIEFSENPFDTCYVGRSVVGQRQQRQAYLAKGVLFALATLTAFVGLVLSLEQPFKQTERAT